MSPRSDGVARSCLVIIAVVAASIGLYLGRELFVPIAIAAVLSAVFRPAVVWLKKARIPESAGAAIVVLGLMAAMGLAMAALSTPVQGWVAEAPRRLDAAQEKLDRLRRPFKKATDAAEKIGQAVSGPTTTPAQPAPAPTPGVIRRMFGSATSIVSGLIGVLLTLYLMLATGDLLGRKFARIASRNGSRRHADTALDETQHLIFRYIVVTFFINTGQAVIITLGMWLMNMPSPWLWGLATIVLEYIPYLGAAVMIVLLAVSAFASFDNLGHILAVPLFYFVVTSIQNNVVSPLAYGQGLKLNPLAVLVGVLFWWFVWGIPGAFIAVPLVGVMKVVCDRIERLKAVGELLGE